MAEWRALPVGWTTRTAIVRLCRGGMVDKAAPLSTLLAHYDGLPYPSRNCLRSSHAPRINSLATPLASSRIIHFTICFNVGIYRSPHSMTDSHLIVTTCVPEPPSRKKSSLPACTRHEINRGRGRLLPTAPGSGTSPFLLLDESLKRTYRSLLGTLWGL